MVNNSPFDINIPSFGPLWTSNSPYELRKKALVVHVYENQAFVLAASETIWKLAGGYHPNIRNYLLCTPSSLLMGLYKWECEVFRQLSSIRIGHLVTNPASPTLSRLSLDGIALWSQGWRSDPSCAIFSPHFWPWREAQNWQKPMSSWTLGSYFTKPLRPPLYLGDSETQIGGFCAILTHKLEWRVKMLGSPLFQFCTPSVSRGCRGLAQRGHYCGPFDPTLLAAGNGQR